MTTVVVGHGVDTSSFGGEGEAPVRHVLSEVELDSELNRRDARLLVLGPEVDRPLELAQRAAGIDANVAVIIVAAPDRLGQLRSEMRFMPHLARDVKFVSTSDAMGLKTMVRKAGERTLARRRYSEIVNAVDVPAPHWRPQTRHYLDGLLSHAPMGVILADPRGLILAWNPMAARLSRVEASGIVGRPLEELRSRDGCEALVAFIDSVSTGEIAEGRPVLTLAFSDGDRHHLEATAFPVEGGGDRQGHLILLLDVTERVRAEGERRHLLQRKQEAERLEELGLLAGGVAHDFNNILVGILGNAQLGLEEVKADSTLKPLLADIAAAADQASDLTQQMLAYSGRSKFEVRRVDLSGLVGEVSSLLMSSTAKNARFRVYLADEPLPVEIDVAQWRRVFLNLVTNASDAIGDGQGEITIETGREHLAVERRAELTGVKLPAGDYARVRVEDSGCGIEPAAMARIFHPFFTTKTKGRGLGLSAVLGIVRSHLGEICVRSTVGKGTEFTIRIPLCEDIEAVPGSASRVAKATGGLVLIIDDEPKVVSVAQRVLQRDGYDVLTASDGTMGLELIENHPEADLVLLDASMPGLSGRELLAEMARKGLTTPVVLSSGYHEGEATTSEQFANLRGFLAKPYNIAQLSGLVAKAIRE